jgi:hypothetical protein
MTEMAVGGDERSVSAYLVGERRLAQRHGFKDGPMSDFLAQHLRRGEVSVVPEHLTSP